MFNICALRNIYTYVTNQQMNTDKIFFIIYTYYLLLIDMFLSLLRQLSGCQTRIQKIYNNCTECKNKITRCNS